MEAGPRQEKYQFQTGDRPVFVGVIHPKVEAYRRSMITWLHPQSSVVGPVTLVVKGPTGEGFEFQNIPMDRALRIVEDYKCAGSRVFEEIWGWVDRHFIKVCTTL
jgi:hypothetical protein